MARKITSAYLLVTFDCDALRPCKGTSMCVTIKRIYYLKFVVLLNYAAHLFFLKIGVKMCDVATKFAAEFGHSWHFDVRCEMYDVKTHKTRNN